MGYSTYRIKTRRAEKGQKQLDLTRGRICLACETYKDRECFFENKNGLNGLGSVCKACRSAQPTPPSKKAYYANRKTMHMCVQCGDPALVNNVFCLECWFADKAYTRASSRSAKEAIKALWQEQNGTCYYSDHTLIPGENASLDHQMPKSKGGTDHLSNLKWVTRQINTMKNDMTHEEFIAMCHYIAKKFPMY